MDTAGSVITIGPTELQQLQTLRRQYFQLVPINKILLPKSTVLKTVDAQSWLFSHMFDINRIAHPPPPDRYQLQVLKRLLHEIEVSFEDVENDEISDDLTGALAALMSKPTVSEFTAAQQRAHVTYTFSALQRTGNSGSITLFESRSMLASSSTTGLRTWEAALHLGEFLTIRGYVQGKRVLELGAGTGLLSILCCKYLHAVEVLATDGNHEIVEALEDNLFLNDLEDKQNNIRCRVLRWGRMLDDGEEGQPPDFDIVLGSDITYDPTLLPLLVATFNILLEKNPRITILIAAPIRNDDTFSKFISTCNRTGFRVIDVPTTQLAENQQTGPFYSSRSAIRIVEVKPLENSCSDITAS